MNVRIHGLFVSLFLAALFVLNFQPEIVHAQGTAISYHGRLTSNGVPVSGTYNLTFSLFNAASGGSAVAGPLVTNGVVVNNGLFYVTIDFGAGVWSRWTNWLQIGVETNGAASFTTLSSRQEVLPLPYAIVAGNTSNLLATLPATQLSSPVPLARLPAGVVTNDETSSVTLGNVKLGNVKLFGTLYLPYVVTLYSGPDLLLQAGFENNFFAGPNAGNLTTSGPYNTAIGACALHANTSGVANTANGYGALVENTSGAANVANGFEALGDNTSGSENTANGFAALLANTNGNFNTAVGNRALSLLAGGANNIALGYYAGSALTGNESSNVDIGNVGVAGESGVIRIGTPGIQTATYLAGTVYANGVALTSDRNAKEHFASIDSQAVLAKVAALPVTEWNYKDDKAAEHIGPMAQDFHAAFGLDGADDKHISVVDENGVALAAIQGLNEKLEAESAENEHLKRRLDELEAQVKVLSEKKQ